MSLAFPIEINILDFIFKGIIIGVIASAPMGPVGILCIQRTLNKDAGLGLSRALVLRAVISYMHSSRV